MRLTPNLRAKATYSSMDLTGQRVELGCRADQTGSRHHLEGFPPDGIKEKTIVIGEAQFQPFSPGQDPLPGHQSRIKS